MKRAIILSFLAILSVAVSGAAQILHVDSVTVDSVWNASSWYDQNNTLHLGQNRACNISFIPQGESMAQMFISLSTDSGKTWQQSPESLIVTNPLPFLYTTTQRSPSMIDERMNMKPPVLSK